MLMVMGKMVASSSPSWCGYDPALCVVAVCVVLVVPFDYSSNINVCLIAEASVAVACVVVVW